MNAIEWNPRDIGTAHIALQATRGIYAMREARGDHRPLYRVAVAPRSTRATFAAPGASRICTTGNHGSIA